MSKCGETCLNAGRPPVMVFQFCTVMDSTSEPGENYESDDDDEVGEFEKYVWVPGELKSGFRLFRTEVSLRLPRYSLSTVQVTNNIFVQLGHGIKNVS